MVVGVLSDNAVASYKRFPLVPFEERKVLAENLQYVYQVVEQRELSYKENLLAIKPAYVVHGDNWKQGVQKPIRDEVIQILQIYGGKLIEFPCAEGETLHNIEKRMITELAIPDFRKRAFKKGYSNEGMY